MYTMRIMFSHPHDLNTLFGLQKSGRPPKWLAPSSGVSCAFGAAVVSFSSVDKVRLSMDLSMHGNR